MSVPLHHRAGASVYRSRPGRLPGIAAAWVGSPGWDRESRVLPGGCADVVWNGRELAVVVTRDAALRVAVTASRSSRLSGSVGLRVRCGVAGGRCSGFR